MIRRLALLASASVLAAGCAERWPPDPPSSTDVSRTGALGQGARPGTGGIEAGTRVDRQVQALEPIVASVHFSLRGPNVPATPSIEVQRSRFLGGRAFARFARLLPGPVVVTASLRDGAGTELAVASAAAAVVADTTTVVELSVRPATGSNLVVVDGPFVPTPSARVGSAGAKASQ